MDLVLSFLMVKTSLKMMMMVVHNKGNPIITAFVVNAKVYILSILLANVILLFPCQNGENWQKEEEGLELYYC